MPRGGGSRRSSSRPKPRPAAPPPARTSGAPPPATNQGGGGGILGGMMGTMMQGMALGTGSAMAHRAVDAVVGPRSMEVVHSGEGASAPAAEGAPQGACANYSKMFMDCVNGSDGDISKCQMYHDALQECKRMQMG